MDFFIFKLERKAHEDPEIFIVQSNELKNIYISFFNLLNFGAQSRTKILTSYLIPLRGLVIENQMCKLRTAKEDDRKR